MSDRDRLIGAVVHDSHDDDPDDARVVNVPPVTADEWQPDDDHTVATYPGNEDYDDDAQVVVIVFEDDLAEHGFGDWDGGKPLALSELAEQSIPYYAFPAPRLEVVAMPGGTRS